MSFKISFNMTWLSWLSHCIVFQIRKGNELTDQTIMLFFCLVVFLFNQSRNNAILEPRAGHFRGHVAFEAKDFKMCPRGREYSRGLHLWSMPQLERCSKGGKNFWVCLPISEFFVDLQKKKGHRTKLVFFSSSSLLLSNQKRHHLQTAARVRVHARKFRGAKFFRGRRPLLSPPPSCGPASGR